MKRNGLRMCMVMCLVIVFIIGLFYIRSTKEYFTGLAKGSVSLSQGEKTAILNGVYPLIGKNQISDETSADIWWHKPVFELGSYEQITNNFKFIDNPDDGSCTPASMCGALYHSKKIPSNDVLPLPPVNELSGVRIGYFTSR